MYLKQKAVAKYAAAAATCISIKDSSSMHNTMMHNRNNWQQQHAASICNKLMGHAARTTCPSDN